MDIYEFKERMTLDNRQYKIIFNGKELKTVYYKKDKLYIRQKDETIEVPLNTHFEALFSNEEISNIMNAHKELPISEELNIILNSTSILDYDFSHMMFNSVLLINNKAFTDYQFTNKIDMLYISAIKIIIKFNFLRLFNNTIIKKSNRGSVGNIALQMKKIPELENEFIVLPLNIGKLSLFNIDLKGKDKDFILFNILKDKKINPSGYFPNISDIGDFKGILTFRTSDLSLKEDFNQELFYLEFQLTLAYLTTKVEMLEEDNSSLNFEGVFNSYFQISDDSYSNETNLFNFYINLIQMFNISPTLKISLGKEDTDEYEFSRVYSPDAINQ